MRSYNSIEIPYSSNNSSRLDICGVVSETAISSFPFTDMTVMESFYCAEINIPLLKQSP